MTYPVASMCWEYYIPNSSLEHCILHYCLPNYSPFPNSKHSTMTTLFTSLLLLLLFTTAITAITADTDPYFSKNTLFTDYKQMQSNLKIFIYPLPQNTSLTLLPPLSLFYSSLLASPFLTPHPSQATLFFLPFPPLSTRSLSRHIDSIRTSFPFWDRSLGADHFYLTHRAVVPASTRNVVELRKNAIQISSFPSPAPEFVPHKDLTLPPPSTSSSSSSPPRVNADATRYLGYFVSDHTPSNSGLIDSLKDDADFLIEVSDEAVVWDNMGDSKFCLMTYEVEGMSRLSAAMAQGCVPVVISERPIQDLPLMDVIRWSEMALFVGSGLGVDEMKSVLKRASEEGGQGYERMRRLGMAAAHHLVWSGDAFEMVMYQLWLRRHAIRYSQWTNQLESA